MKNLIFIFSLILSSNAFAAASVYSFETMKCEGIQYGHAPVADQDRVVMVATAADGKVQMAAQYFALSEETNFTAATESWEVGSFYTEGRDVFRRSVSGRGDGLHLKVTGSVIENGLRVDRLEGTWLFKNAAAGSYGYHVRCVAYAH